jgi:tetratricopeptide (TPR) repeat protein
VDAHYHYAWLLELLLRDDEAIRHGEITKELNPLAPFYAAWLADQYRDSGRYDEAMAEAEETLALNPEYPVAWMTLGFSYIALGRFDDAIAAHKHLESSPFWSWVPAATLLRTGRVSDVEEAKASIADIRTNVFTDTLLHGAAGEHDKTLALLRKNRDARIPWYPWLLTWFEETKFLHADPELRALADEIGIPMPEPDA